MCVCFYIECFTAACDLSPAKSGYESFFEFIFKSCVFICCRNEAFSKLHFYIVIWVFRRTCVKTENTDIYIAILPNIHSISIRALSENLDVSIFKLVTCPNSLALFVFLRFQLALVLFFRALATKLQK